MSGAGRVGRRLQRILLLVPYAIHHPGVSLDELARKFSISREELKKDLELLFLCGLPGYGPGDLIDVDTSGDRVFVRMADYFEAPLRLTSPEALSLYAAGSALASLPEMDQADALKRAIAKLGRALGSGQGDDAVDVELEAGHEGHLMVLQEALAKKLSVHLEYFSARRNEMTERDIDPWGLVAALGHWYVVGFDHSSSEERMFRVDRMRSATLLDPEDAPVWAGPSSDFDPAAYRSAWRDQSAGRPFTVELSPEVARWFPDYYPLRASEGMSDGWMRVELTSSGDRWAACLVLRLGPGVRAVEPASVREEAAVLARKIVARHSAG